MNQDPTPDAPAPRGPFLRVLEGKKAGTVYDLSQVGEATFGGEGADHVLVPGRAGGLCRFRPEGNVVVAEDLTQEGILVNHRRRTEAELRDGDLIVADEAVLLYLEEETPFRPQAMAVEAGRLTSLDLIELPRLFHSVYADGPFRECLICSRPLGDPTSQYYVEKVYRGTEVILECAICMGCMHDMQSEFSQESKERLEAFGRGIGATGHSFARCDLCGAKRATLGEFNLICGCLGPWMIQKAIFILCGVCVEKIQALLSKKTRDVHGDFVDTHFPGVPQGYDVPTPMLL